MATRPDAPAPAEGGWAARALAAVALVTGLRLLLLAFDRTDLFVDESQYWLWGRHLDFGYYSKPPLIAWVIRLATGLAGSDAPFWVRMPGAILHGAAAMILAALAARIAGGRAAIAVALAYVTLPFAALGSLLISTDTVMAPFYALALFAWFRLAESRQARFALLAGIAAGAACMAKYAGAYFLLGAGLAAAFVPQMRPGWRNAALLLAAFALTILPNVLWNLTHGLATVSHTMDNVGWVREDRPLALLHPGKAVAFLAAQFVVAGPILFAALLAAVSGAGRDPKLRALLLMSLPVVAIVCGQALLSRAYANWAIAAYFAGTVAAVLWLQRRFPRLLGWSLALNGAMSLALPLLTILAPWPEAGGAPLLKRYLGRADLSRQIIATAHEAGVGAVYSFDRDILADLFHTGEGSGLFFYAPRPSGRPRNYYEQTFPLPEDPGPVLMVLAGAPVCDGRPVPALRSFDTAGGAYAKWHLAAYLLPEGCDVFP